MSCTSRCGRIPRPTLPHGARVARHDADCVLRLDRVRRDRWQRGKRWRGRRRRFSSGAAAGTPGASGAGGAGGSGVPRAPAELAAQLAPLVARAQIPAGHRAAGPRVGSGASRTVNTTRPSRRCSATPTGYAGDFPGDTIVHGFTNNSDVQDVALRSSSSTCSPPRRSPRRRPATSTFCSDARSPRARRASPTSSNASASAPGGAPSPPKSAWNCFGSSPTGRPRSTR
jgi:hypothetical protein